MALRSIGGLVALSLLVSPGGPVQADESGPTLWRALGASAHERTFAIGLSAKKATKAEAVASMHKACVESQERCTLVATFSGGCRFVALGGKPTGPNTSAPVFVVGSSAEDAKARCRMLDLVCDREPKGGCFE